MVQIFTNFSKGSKQKQAFFVIVDIYGLLPVEKSVNISAILRYAVKSKT